MREGMEDKARKGLGNKKALVGNQGFLNLVAGAGFEPTTFGL